MRSIKGKLKDYWANGDFKTLNEIRIELEILEKEMNDNAEPSMLNAVQDLKKHYLQHEMELKGILDDLKRKASEPETHEIMGALKEVFADLDQQFQAWGTKGKARVEGDLLPAQERKLTPEGTISAYTVQTGFQHFGLVYPKSSH